MPLITVNNMLRFEENLIEGTGSYYNVKKMLYEGRNLQDIVVFESTHHGKVLAIDRSIQLTEREEGTYHEAIAYVPLFAHGNAEQVLIVGGGDGGVAARVITHPSVRYVKQIEIDNTVVDIAKKHLFCVHKGVFDDPRLDLEIGDGAKYVKETDKRFDVVIVDCSDPDPKDSANNILYTEDFYRDVKRILSPRGVFIMQSGTPNQQGEELQECIIKLRSLFMYATCYLVDAPMYCGGNLALSFATDAPDVFSVPLEVLKTRFELSAIDTEYYTPELHQAMFILPNYVLKLIRGITPGWCV